MSDVQRVFAETKKAFGAVDVLVNNAGVYEFAPLDAITEEQFHRLFNTNVLGLILASQEAAETVWDPGSEDHQYRIGGHQSALPDSAVYTGTKGAVDSVTQMLARSWDRKGFGSTRSIRAWWKPRARNWPDSSDRNSRKGLSRRLRSAESGKQATSRRLQSF